MKMLNLAIDLILLSAQFQQISPFVKCYYKSLSSTTSPESIKIRFLFEFTNCIKNLFVHGPFPFSIFWIDNTSGYKRHNIFFNCSISMINIIFLEIDASAFQWFKSIFTRDRLGVMNLQSYSNNSQRILILVIVHPYQQIRCCIHILEKQNNSTEREN